MYSIWNSTNQEQDLLATFQLGKGQTYLYPVHVPASGTAMIDVKEIAQMGTPDVNGNTLPVSVTQGRVSISAASGKPIDPINVVISGGIYNPTKATCGYTWETCNGCTTFYLNPNPFDGTVSVLEQVYAQCPWTNGTLYDFTTDSNWTSGDPSFITIQTQGDSQPGMANPVSAGDTDLYALLPNEPVSMGQICASPPLPNCQYTQAQPSAPASVQVPTSVSVISSSVASPGCGGSTNYGVKASITYQVLDQSTPTGKPILLAGMTPYESGTWFDGSTLASHPLGAPTTANGQFTDSPLGACANLPFSKNLTATQNIQVLLNGRYYSVRTNNWTESDSGGSNGFGHGTLTNSNDVTVTR